MIEKTESTFWVKIYVSGPIEIAYQVCREYCLSGLCITIDPTRFIYTGGEELGYVVGLINYPRFPSSDHEIFEKAENLARQLLERTCQHSVLIMSPDKTLWITKRDQ